MGKIELNKLQKQTSLLNTAYELYKKNQYGKYLKDVMDGKFVDQ